MENSGDVFDYSDVYSQENEEVEKLIDYFYKMGEIKGKSILDAGCRTGDYSFVLYKKGAKKVEGIDLSRKCIETARKKYKSIKTLNFNVKDIRNLKSYKENSFDSVLCVGTIFYVPPKDVEKVLREFLRIIKPGGSIVVLFQKEKNLFIKFARFFANFLPLKLYFFLVEYFGFLVKPLAEKIEGRKISLDYLKYDILLSLRGIHFGIPAKIPKKYLVETPSLEQCSEKTTTSFKIIVPPDKFIF